VNTLESLGLLEAGKRGLGFAVGKEPLAAYFASQGCEIVASDLDPDIAVQKGWTKTNQHAAVLADLNDRGICPDDAFGERASFRVVDMNAIPDDLRDFDFSWSCCAFEHLGSIDHGLAFVRNQIATLKPGGVGVHTTEFNVSSNRKTVKEGGTVLFRKRDMQQVAKELRREGHEIEIDFDAGSQPMDKFVDVPPYKNDPHLRLQIAKFTCTSIGLVVRRGA